MKQYELRKYSIEISHRNRFEIAELVTESQFEQDSELIATFATEEKAIAELKQHISHVRDHGNLYVIDEYKVEWAEYDEDGEWIDGDVIDYSRMLISVVEDETNKKLATFNNYKDADDFIRNHDDKNAHIVFNE